LEQYKFSYSGLISDKKKLDLIATLKIKSKKVFKKYYFLKLPGKQKKKERKT